jgi:RNA polymerase sigma factor for flagellar operon FliA
MAMTAPAKTSRQLIEDNQGLVRSLAKRIHRGLPSHVEFEDLVGYGQAGLAEAARSFDPAVGSQFSTFAYYRIRGAIYDGLAKMNWFSRSQYQQVKTQQMSAEVLAVDGESPAESSSLKDDVNWLTRTSGALGVVYLMTRGAEDAEGGAQELADPSTPTPAVELARRELAAKLHQLLDELPAEAAALTRGVYFEGLTLQEAGERIGVSKAWASRLHARTLERLARSLRRMGVSDAE